MYTCTEQVMRVILLMPMVCNVYHTTAYSVAIISKGWYLHSSFNRGKWWNKSFMPYIPTMYNNPVHGLVYACACMMYMYVCFWFHVIWVKKTMVYIESSQCREMQKYRRVFKKTGLNSIPNIHVRITDTA